MTRLLAIAALIGVLVIPLAMIEARVEERAARRDEAATEVASSLGGPQIVGTPTLRVGVSHKSLEGGHEVTQTQWIVLPPRSLEIEGNVETQVRHRGIFEIPTFSAKVHMNGRFAIGDDDALPVPLDALDWTHATIDFAVADAAHLGGDTRLTWNGQALSLEAVSDETGATPVMRARLHPEFVGGGGGALGDFRLDFELSGSRDFRFAPIARTVHAHVTGGWPHPSFQGQWLPGKSTLSTGGFDATWAMSSLGRGYAPAWIEAAPGVARPTHPDFGFALHVPVDPYRMGERIAKYGVLLVAVTFCAVWVMELTGGKRLHFVQYLLLGASLCLFGLLQLALAEHIGFARAYAVAATCVLLQASFYTWSATGSRLRALFLGVVLAGWFTYLYVVLAAEDQAFLLGSIALFVALTGVMWATRRVDWNDRRARWDVAAATLDAGVSS